VPTEYCNVHVETTLCYDGENYHLATDACEKKGTTAAYGLLNIARQFPIANIVVADQQYCVGTLTKQAGYSEARCDTLDPVNEECTTHKATTTRTTRTEEQENNDDEDNDDNQDNDDGQDGQDDEE
jgi:hypothetical protein